MPRSFPHLETERLLLRVPDLADVVPILEYQRRNADHFAPWNPKPPRNFLTREYWIDRVALYHTEFPSEKRIQFYLFSKNDPDHVVGQAALSNVVRGVAQYCTLGYGIGAADEGRGLMREGLEAVIRYGFDELNLHRIMANYMPHNVRSGALLRRLGFTVEGYARDYLMIAGKWEDHVLTSLTNREWRE